RGGVREAPSGGRELQIQLPRQAVYPQATRGGSEGSDGQVNTGTGSTDRPSRGPASDHDNGPETAGERRLASILMAGSILFVLGPALWLGDALLETRRIDDCISSGRRNCAPITAPSPQLR